MWSAWLTRSVSGRVPAESRGRSGRESYGRHAVTRQRRAEKTWWAGTGLNRRHQDFQSCALPTELPAHQTREDNRRARVASTSRRAPGALLDGGDDADRAHSFEEERDDDDLAGLQLTGQLRERH